jgi:signal peptidase I
MAWTGARFLAYSAAAVIAAAVLAITVPAFAGMHSVTVYGGSMGDALPVGSVAVTRSVDAGDLKVGNIIAVGAKAGTMPTLHRIVSLEDARGERLATTRGDANATNDAPIVIRGQGDRVVYYVPFAGYALAFTRTLLGMLLLVLPAVVWVIWRVGSMRSASTAPAAAR